VTHGLDTSFLLAVEIVEHAHHADALRLLTELLAQGDRMAIAPQVLAEFVHVVTDERRFQQPFPMETALNKSEHWWNAAEADQVLPTDVAIALFHTWMLDTLLAATYRAADVTSLLTLNATDFTVFDELACVPIPALRHL
jgi:predicted nucleic acid-binding protein